MSVEYVKDPVFVFIRDIILGDIISPPSSSLKLLKTFNGEHLYFVRVLATIVDKYHSSGTLGKKEYTSLTIDDGTASIQIKAWDDKSKELNLFNVGDVVDVFARPRRSKDQDLYLTADKIFSVDDYNHELYLRTRRILRYIKKGFRLPKIVLVDDDFAMNQAIQEATDTIWELFLVHSEGLTLEEIIEKTKLPKKIVETVIQDFLRNGTIYEPEPLKFKKVS